MEDGSQVQSKGVTYFCVSPGPLHYIIIFLSHFLFIS